VHRPQSADQRLFEKTTAGGELQLFLSKKRQRPKTAEVKKAESEDLGGKTAASQSPIPSPASRYIKASHRQSSAGGGGGTSGSKHRFFKSRTKDKDASPTTVAGGPPPPLNSLLLLGKQQQEAKTASQQHQQPSFFNLRYKSLTNLTQQVRNFFILLSFFSVLFLFSPLYGGDFLNISYHRVDRVLGFFSSRVSYPSFIFFVFCSFCSVRK
jgi:hypothetical protein